MLAASCSQESNDLPSLHEGQYRMKFNFSMPFQTKATDTEFETGDKVALFVKETGRPLEISGNIVNNEAVTFSGHSWDTERQLYWNDGEYDAFAYYPYTENIISVKDFPFSIKTDQTSKTEGYAESDFLFASSKGITATDTPIDMKFRHIMSRLSIRLIKGEDYEGDLPETATVRVHNTVIQATIDLTAGIATPDPMGKRSSVTAMKYNSNSYTAIIVPQRLSNRVPLIEVTMNGVSLLYESKFLFKPGVHHIVNFIIERNPDQAKIEIGGEFTEWN